MNIKSKIDSLKDIKMKQFKQDININKGAMKTHVKLELDGKTIMDEDGHSILAGFAQELYLAMRGETDTLTTRPEKLAPNIIPLKITSAEAHGGTYTRLNYVNGYGEYNDTSNYTMWIYGTGTSLDGNKYTVATGSASSNYIVINTAWTGHEAEYGAISGGYAVSLLTTNTNIFPTYYNALTMYIRLGYNATAVAITDDIPQIAVELTHGVTTYSAVTPDADNDRVDLIYTMTATNNTAGAITVSDVNMLRYDDTYTSYLFARDLLSVPVPIPAGGSLTVTYTIRTTTDLESDNMGGFTQRLLEILRGISTTTDVLDIDNTTRTISSAPNRRGIFKVVYMPRNQPSRVNHTANTTPAWWFGIILGTGTAEPDLSDYHMANDIEDGAGAGQLKYWASFVDGYTEAATSRSFNVSRIVQNSSGSAIVVSELGLGVCCYSDGEHPYYSALIARHVLKAADPDNRITIADGEFCIITYTITIEV